MESACLCLPRSEILEILCPKYFKGREIWSIYIPDIYDTYESPAEITYFYLEYLSEKDRKMKSFFSPVGSILYALVFRPHLMDISDFSVLKEALAYFDVPPDNPYLCIKCSSRNIRNIAP
mgnify:CR=1 FL=1